jgi:hypothetical protein
VEELVVLPCFLDSFAIFIRLEMVSLYVSQGYFLMLFSSLTRASSHFFSNMSELMPNGDVGHVGIQLSTRAVYLFGRIQLHL